MTRVGWDASGEWVPAPSVDEGAAEELFRHKVLALLRRRGLLSLERIAGDILRAYRLPVDAGFEERLLVVARVLSLVWLHEAREQDSDVPKHLRWVRNAFSGAVRYTTSGRGGPPPARPPPCSGSPRG